MLAELSHCATCSAECCAFLESELLPDRAGADTQHAWGLHAAIRAAAECGAAQASPAQHCLRSCAAHLAEVVVDRHALHLLHLAM